MARFRASILRTGKHAVSRQSSTGIETHTCGERVGIRVHTYIDQKTGQDTLVVFLTGGKQNPTGERIGVYVESKEDTLKRVLDFALRLGLDDESLCSTIIDIAFGTAASVNNAGLVKQLQYLLEEGGVEHTERWIREAAG